MDTFPVLISGLHLLFFYSNKFRYFVNYLPRGIAFDINTCNVYVTTYGNNRIQIFTNNGDLLQK